MPLIGVIAVLALAAGAVLGSQHHGESEQGIAGVTARLRHMKIAPRRALPAAAGDPIAPILPAKGPIIGTNDGVGWGRAAARTIVRGHITWNRVALGSPPNTLAGSLSDGFKVLLIVANVADRTPLSQIDPSSWGAEVVSELKARKGVGLAEAGNESYLKGDVANPIQYGRMYLDAVEDMKAARIRIPLLFNMTGDIPHNTWADPQGWSEDDDEGGWLREAVAAVPGLAAAILANGVSIHPYGAVGENSHDDLGTGSAAAEEAVANTVLGSIPPFYVTEIGYALGRCGAVAGACSERQQATKLQAAYEVFLADPHIYGIWWYQSHDDPTGNFGFMSNSNRVRPAFKVLSAIASAAGQ